MSSKLAIEGGNPVRSTMLPYARQWIDEQDVEAVVRVLRSDFLTTGPKVEEFEEALATRCGVSHAVAVSSGTAALHAAMYAAGVRPGDEVIVPSMTFAATVNSVIYQGATPIFADVEETTLLIDPHEIERHIGPRTKAIVAVDYAGQPADFDRLNDIAKRYDLPIIADACHSLGANYRGKPVGSLAHLSTFSLHPVKHVTAGEGGLVTTDDEDCVTRLRMFRNHGISQDYHQRAAIGSWFYEILELGYNYRLTDFQCALAQSQLEKLPRWIERRREIAARFDDRFSKLHGIAPLSVRPEVEHAYHLYVIRVLPAAVRVGRAEIFAALRAEGIGVNVHYIPVHLHPFYRHKLGTGPGLCPVAESAYEQIMSLPIFPAMTPEDVQDVIDAVVKVVSAYRRCLSPRGAV